MTGGLTAPPLRPTWRPQGLAVGVSLVVHGGVLLGLAGVNPSSPTPERAPPVATVLVLPPVTAPRPSPAPARVLPRGPERVATPTTPGPAAAPPPPGPQPPAAQAAPAAPTAEEWAFAARYPLKNSKGYRYSWGQQVRSMMGTAVAGPDQGHVRFRVEIAPDGRLTSLETLWATSAVAERRARQAIERMPRLPPTPTGRPLVFERTISFTPDASDGPPVYRDDCLPDPPAFRNPFVWDGQGEPPRAAPLRTAAADGNDGLSMSECLKLLPQDTVEAEAAHDRRLQDQWDSSTLGR